MGKLLIIIFGLYALYYTGNIIYDLFLKKQPGIKEETDERTYSIQAFADESKAEPVSVGIDETETLQTPGNSFTISEEEFNSTRGQEPDFERMREKYEKEQEAEKPFEKQEPESKEEKGLFSSTNEPEPDEAPKFKETVKLETRFIPKEIPADDDSFNDIINQAKTKVQVLTSLEGYKVYTVF